MATLQVTGHGTRKLKPLSTSLSFRFEGGAPVQAVNAVTGEHVPDWRFSPIRIVPVITVTDPEGLVTNGVHNSDTPVANMRWLYDETGVNVLAGVSPADMSMDTSASGLRGALNIRRNFDAGALLRFEYEFTTSVGGVLRTARHSATVAIKVNQMADALVQVRTAYPRGQFVFFPSPDAPSGLAMDMRLYHNGRPCPTAYRWYAVNKDGQETILHGQDGPVLTRPANSVQNVDHYRCKALDMRPEHAEAVEAATAQARADVYRKYLGDDWETVLPGVRGNRLRYGAGHVENQFYTLSPTFVNQLQGVVLKRKYRNGAPISPEPSAGLIERGKKYILSYYRGQEYLQLPNEGEGSYVYIGRGGMENTVTSTTDDGARVCVSFRAKIDSNYINLYCHLTASTADMIPDGIRYWGFKLEEVDDSGGSTATAYLPVQSDVDTEIRARAEEIVAAQTLPPPTDWPLSRTYTRDFSLRVHTVSYELVLDVEGLGERTIVRNGSLAVGSGAGQELFSGVPRSMTQMRSRILCRQGGHTYSVEETARMFDVQWPGSATNVDGCSATMNDLQFALSITPKY